VGDLGARELDHEAVEAPLFRVAADPHAGDWDRRKLIGVATADLGATGYWDRGGAGRCRSREADACQKRGRLGVQTYGRADSRRLEGSPVP
jgi:hypothetical protein